MASRRGPDGTARVAISGSLGGKPWANIFWVNLTTGSSIIQADLDTWTTNFQAAYKSNFGPTLTSTATYGEAVATYFAPGGGVLQSDIAMAGAGTNASAIVLDLSASPVVSWLSSVYWRGGKPRTYLPGLSSSYATNGFDVNATGIAAILSAAGGFRTAINALSNGTIGGTALGFVSFYTHGALRPAPDFFTIAGAKVHPRIGSQRRRLGKWQV